MASPSASRTRGRNAPALGASSVWDAPDEAVRRRRPMVKHIDRLTDKQEAQMVPWAKKWIAIGLRTGETDWGRFEQGARACYRFTKLAEPRVVVRVQSPLVLALAAPIAGWLLDNRSWEDAAIAASRNHGAVGEAVGEAVGDAVRDAVR